MNITSNDVFITSFQITTLFAIDLALISDGKTTEFDRIRGLPSWLPNLSKTFKENQSKLNSFQIEFESSAYSKTDKAERNTFSDYYLQNMMPLVIQLNTPTIKNNLPFKNILPTIRIGRHGALSLRFSSLSNDNLKDAPILVEDFISIYYEFRKLLRAVTIEILDNFSKIWNEEIKILSLNTEAIHKHIQNFEIYEVFDFDFSLGNGKSNTINELFDQQNRRSLKQLARLFRMTKSAYEQYDDSKLVDLKNQNIGFRSDELWIVNDERLVRYHPEKNIYLSAFLQDVILGFEILKQQEANLVYLNNWVLDKREFLRNKLYYSELSLNKELSKIWIDVVHLYDNTLEQFGKQRNIRHSFYNLLISKARDSMRIAECSNEVKGEFTELFGTLNALSSLQLSNAMLDVENTNLTLNQTGQKLNKRIWILTIIMAIAAFLQILITVISFYDNPLIENSTHLNNVIDTSKKLIIPILPESNDSINKLDTHIVPNVNKLRSLKK